MGILSFFKKKSTPKETNDHFNKLNQRVKEVEEKISSLIKNGNGFFECKGEKYPLHIIAEIYDGEIESEYVSGYSYILHLQCSKDVGTYGIYICIDQEEKKQIAPGKLVHEERIENTCSACFYGTMEFENKKDDFYNITDGEIEIDRGRNSKLTIKGKLEIKHNSDPNADKENITFEFEGIPACFEYSDRE